MSLESIPHVTPPGLYYYSFLNLTNLLLHESSAPSCDCVLSHQSMWGSDSHDGSIMVGEFTSLKELILGTTSQSANKGGSASLDWQRVYFSWHRGLRGIERFRIWLIWILPSAIIHILCIPVFYQCSNFHLRNIARLWIQICYKSGTHRNPFLRSILGCFQAWYTSLV